VKIKTFITTLIIYIFLQNSGAFGQDVDSLLYKNYSFAFSNNTITEMVDSIRNKTNLGFSYNPNYIPRQKRHSCLFTNCPLYIILDSIFKPCKITYKLIGTTIAISRDSNDKSPEIEQKPEKKDSVSFLLIEGILKDVDNKAPVPFANIYLKNRQWGTISNNDGNFSLKVPIEFKDDTVNFSFVGYKTAVIPVLQLLPEGNMIAMEPTVIRLKEVTITYIKPDELLQKAIQNIPKNYSSKAMLATGFYRETIRQNNQYVALTEAILKIYKASYTSYMSDQASIYKSRKSPFVKQMDTIFFKLQGGIHTSLMLDIAKNHSTFISGDNFLQYDYTFEGITTFQGHNLYIIAFDQKDNIAYPLFRGKLYIDTESLAFVKADFGLSPKGIRYAAGIMVKKSPPGVKVRPIEASYQVSYTEQNNKWYLSHIRESLKIKVRKRFNLFNIVFQSTAELAITQSDSIASKRFKSGQTIKANDIFVEKTVDYDPKFWEDFNYIPPDKTLEEAFEELREKTAKIN
jgi:hypothetical protein